MRSSRSLARCGVLVVTLSLIAMSAAVNGADRGRGSSSPTASPGWDALPGEGLHTSAVRQYSMSGYVRPLLFWFGRDDIGLARVVWRTGEDGARGYELLVGTDPAKAPRAMNRWGFVSEEVHGAEGAVLALMTGSDEGSFDEAKASTDRSNGSDFRAMQSRIHEGSSAWQTVRVQTAGTFSVHDVDTALDSVRRETAAARSRQAPLPDGARPGFLIALAELIEHGAGHLPESELGRRARQTRVSYVFGQGAYELRMRDAERTTLMLNGRNTPVVRSAFEILTVATAAHTRFEVMFGTDGALTGVPVAASWQPRWWLKVELRLAESNPG